MNKNTERDIYEPSVQKPLILAVETSGRTGSVALALGQQLLAESCFSAPMRHSAEIFPAVFGLLERFGRRPSQIEHVYISIGPGSFTGLRIAATFAKIMHLANAAKIVAVNTLDVIAANATDYAKKKKCKLDRIATVLDAKRGQFFIAVYQSSRGRWTKLAPDCLMSAEDFLAKFAADKPLWLLGEGLVYYKDKFASDGICFLDGRYWYPKAEKVHLLGWQMALAGQFADALTLQPAYLRGADVKQKR
jgi:tRNA threonylcarbamoyladenosine biosynthesis protein TsaB